MMQREVILQKLREDGCRITKQRQVIVDIILEHECSCCKEIYYKAVQLNPKIGSATVYRMVNKLEEIGAISRKNMYKACCENQNLLEGTVMVTLDDETTCCLSPEAWNDVLKAGLQAKEYLKNQNITTVSLLPCHCSGKGCEF